MSEHVTTQKKVKLSEPEDWNVIIINDDVTPEDFVIDLLIELFNKNETDAEELTTEIHEYGAAVVGTFNFEIAETKASEATAMARMAKFPLQIKIEKVS